MITKIKIDNWVDFNRTLLKSTQSNRRNYFFYDGKKIQARVKIYFICNCCKKEHLFSFFNLKNIDIFEYKCGSCLRKEYYLKFYGVENVSQLDFIKNKKKETMIKNYGIGNSLSLEKTKKTILERYGVENISQSKNIQEKIRQVNLENHGVEYVFQREDIKEKIKQTNLENYGVEYALQRDDVKAKQKQTIKDNYGVENISQSEEIKEKKRKTCLEHYGVENGFLLEKSITKNIEISQKKYNTNYSFNGLKQKQTIEGNYGVENISQSEEIKEKKRKTCLEHYGVDTPAKNSEILHRIMSSNGRKMCIKNINKNLHYQTQPELDFIKYCWSKNINITDGPSIKYSLNNKEHRYHIDFETDKFLIEIKSNHGWYKKDLESGKIEAKNKAAEEYAQSIDKKFLFLLEIKDYYNYI